MHRTLMIIYGPRAADRLGMHLATAHSSQLAGDLRPAIVALLARGSGFLVTGQHYAVAGPAARDGVLP
jgi:hypothetical protein